MSNVETCQVPDEDEEPPVSFTWAAIEALKRARALPDCIGEGLRVSVLGGGCAGFMHNLEFGDAQGTDITFVVDGIKVFIDPISAAHLEGTTIDFVTTVASSGFKFRNPHATKTCGCGSSFG